MTVKKVILWLPVVILVLAVIAVTLLLVTSNTNRIAKLEQAKDPNVITFTFNQNSERFRIVCNQTDNSDIYVCTTIRLNPTPTPTPTR